MSLALFIVKVLRKLPRTARFDKHLDDCAAYEVFYRAFDDSLPPLTVKHALAKARLPDSLPTFGESGTERVNGSVLRLDQYRRRANPVII